MSRIDLKQALQRGAPMPGGRPWRKAGDGARQRAL